jgi:hypothetical protein
MLLNSEIPGLSTAKAADVKVFMAARPESTRPEPISGARMDGLL